MRFGVLGPLEVTTDAGRPVRIPELKVRGLLADLLVHGGAPVSSGRLIDDLWGPDRPGDPAGALRVKVSQLRRALEDAEPGGRELVESGRAGYRLRADLDADRFRERVARARAAAEPAVRAGLLTGALALWRGPALADFADEEFARGAAARLEEERLTALDDLAEARLALGEHHALVAELGDLAVRHPLRERLQANLIRALYRSGRQHEALEGYRRLRDRLREELGLDPSPELAALHQAILEQDPSLQAPARAVPRTNLPVPLTELIGRDAEVDAVRGHLARSRLVTLTGPGGVGKTRLALEAAARSAGAYPDGVFLVELAALPPDPDAIDEAVTAVAGPEPSGGALLVLDNCEHAVDAVAKTAGRLLAAGARVLATGQEPLGISGELLHVVPPLAQADAERLFAARAAAAAPGFAADADTAAVAAVCRRLDGIPLALELAAARVRALGVRELAERLDDRFAVLNSGRRGSPARQRTLRAMMDWSWEPLGEAERAVLRRLAVHAGGCTLLAAELTCAGGEVARPEIADVIARLVDRSLVTMAGGRYRLLESVAAYSLERLREAGEDGRVQELHDDYYTRLAECAEEYRAGHARLRWLARLDDETANLRAALESTVRRGDTRRALRLTAALAWFWIDRGRTGEGHRALRTALAEAAGDPRLRAAAAGDGEAARLLAAADLARRAANGTAAVTATADAAAAAEIACDPLSAGADRAGAAAAG
ncbi:BTAD domain-containing putative transcriptional regulator [Spirillospora sp. NPDC029432]|uniref:BTAD domain-containing putative transcriptional regulator n=1 Tax=Spirillospora sp. NPDC029432 TaxID=3154599 RepID=UPI0034555E20